MLIAISIKNFKSIREAHVRFGPFTCFIGHNGVGKSNLFDAIHFLSELAERDISDAAADVRRASDGAYSPLALVFGRHQQRTIELSADMIVPTEVEDDFGQSAK
ncbi:MAG: AAA family ATPase, partial [Acidimicrobiaceae bacterium]|nr:AAA family ATPase [Acidimicrobiaceae bacterium]